MKAKPPTEDGMGIVTFENPDWSSVLSPLAVYLQSAFTHPPHHHVVECAPGGALRGARSCGGDREEGDIGVSAEGWFWGL